MAPRTDLVPISRGMPRYSQDSFVDWQTNQNATPEQWASHQRSNEEFARTHPNFNWDPYHIPWWEPWMGIAGVAAGGALAGAFSGAGAGGTAAAGGAGTGAASSLPTVSSLGIPIGTGVPAVGTPIAGGLGTAAGAAGTGGTVAGTGGWLNTLGQVAGVPSGSGTAGWIRAGVDRIPQIAALARGAQGLETGRAAGRVAEANQANAWDRLNLLRNATIQNRAQTELEQRKWAQDLQERAAKQATRGQLLQQARPGAGISIPPELAQFQGRNTNVRIGDIPQATRDELGGAMYRNSITELLDPLQPGTASSGRRMAELPLPDPLSPTPEANGYDTALNAINTAGTFLPAIYDLIRGPQRPPPSTTAPGGVTPGITLTGGPNPFAGGATPPRTGGPSFTGGAQLPRISPGTSPGATPPPVVQPNVGMFSGQGRTGVGAYGSPGNYFPVGPYSPPPDQFGFMRGMR